jgi:hypothetical protein
MHRRFIAMDAEKKGFITVQQFTLLPELCCNPIADLIAASFDSNKVGRVLLPPPHASSSYKAPYNISRMTHRSGQQN